MKQLICVVVTVYISQTADAHSNSGLTRRPYFFFIDTIGEGGHDRKRAVARELCTPGL